MAQLKNLQKAPNGYYYLRLQRDGKDRRLSLKTRDLTQAQIAVNFLHATLCGMKTNLENIKGWTVELEGDKLKIQTEDNAEDRASALEAVKILAEARSSRQDSYKSVIQSRVTKTLGEAMLEYLPVLAKSNTAVKTQRMAESTLTDLSKRLGGGFNMHLLNDEIIEEKWLNARLEVIAATTAKRDLTFIRGFVDWAADKKRGYSPAPLTLTVQAKGENWDYYSAQDLKLIFNSLPKYAETAWQLWTPLIALYTGARISEIASLKTENFIEKNGVKAMKLEGTKTAASNRTIPIHQDLIELGLLDLVSTRHDDNKVFLFDIKSHNQNGAGATVSKWYTKFKQSIKLNGDRKVFHSFRPTLVDHLKQAGVDFEARCQYVGHDAGGGVHNKVYGRNELNLQKIYQDVVQKINWQKYCGWEPDLKLLKIKAGKVV